MLLVSYNSQVRPCTVCTMPYKSIEIFVPFEGREFSKEQGKATIFSSLLSSTTKRRVEHIIRCQMAESSDQKPGNYLSIGASPFHMPLT